MTLQVVILTATDETPFNSKSPKHLHQLAGHPILNYAIDLANQLSSDTPIIAVNPGLTEMIAQVKGENVHFIHTSPERKSWLSLTEIQPSLKRDTTDLLLLHADTPLIQLESLQQLIKCHKNAGIGLTILTRDDICLENKSIEDESNAYYQLSDFCPLIISVELLTSHLLIVDETTDDTTFNMGFILQCAMNNHIPVRQLPPLDPNETLNIKTRVDFARGSKLLQRRINHQHMLSGITIIDPDTVYIDNSVVIGCDTTIMPNTFLTGKTVIGEGCQIGPAAVIDHSQIGDRCRVFTSVLEYAVMEHDSDVGPFSHLRKGAYVCTHAHVGNYGEMKNSRLGPGAKMGHVSYLGDTTVGADTNIGAGTITCNFDGQEKHPTTIGDNTFIGSGTLIVSPIDIGDNAITGAGSVVTHNIPANTLVYGVPARKKGVNNVED